MDYNSIESILDTECKSDWNGLITEMSVEEVCICVYAFDKWAFRGQPTTTIGRTKGRP